MNHREYFNSIAYKWDTISKINSEKISEMLDALKISDGDKVLDVGTGTGVLIPYIHDLVGRNGKITALDISGKMIDIARKKYPYDNTTFVTTDIMYTDYDPSYFDIIICYSSFPHFIDKENILKKLNYLLKPKGKILIAHSQSRAAINEIHKNMPYDISKDYLPELDIIKELLVLSGFIPVFEKEDDVFIVIGEKQ